MFEALQPRRHFIRLRQVLRQPVAGGAAGLVAMRILGLILGFTATLLLGAKLGPDGFGLFALAASIGLLTALAIRLGSHTLLVRAIASGEDCDAWQAVRLALSQWGLFSVIVLMLVGGAWLTIDGLRTGRGAMAVLSGSLLGPLIALQWLASSILQGRHKVIRGFFGEYVLQPGLLLAGIGALSLTGGLNAQTSIMALLASFGIAALLTTAASLLALPKQGRVPGKRVPAVKLWIGASGLLFLANIFLMSIGRIEIFLLGALADPSMVGIFAMGLRLVQPVQLPNMALSSALAPQLARMADQGDCSAIQERLTLAAHVNALATVAISIAAIGLTFLVLPLIGADFEQSALVVMIIATGYCLGALFGHGSITLAMLEQDQLLARAAVAVMAVFLLLLFLLIPPLGAIGAAVALSIVFTLNSSLMAYMLWRTQGLRCDVFKPTTRNTGP